MPIAGPPRALQTWIFQEEEKQSQVMSLVSFRTVRLSSCCKQVLFKEEPPGADL